MTTAHISETRIERNDDGSAFVDNGPVRITHDDSEGDDRLLLDADSEMSLADAADLHRALGVMLGWVDPSGVNRVRVAPVDGAAHVVDFNRHVELAARRIASTKSPLEIEAHVLAGAEWHSERVEYTAYARADHLLSLPLQGPAPAPIGSEVAA